MLESPYKRTVAVGIFVLLGTAFLITGILLVGNLRETFSTKIALTTLFDDVGGLQKGDNIWFSGVKIGTIENVEFYGHSQVKVTMAVKVEAQQYIRKDAKVKLGSDGLLGNKILILFGGSEDQPVIENGDTIQMEETLGSEEILAMLQRNNENILAITSDLKYITQKISSGEGSLGKLIYDDNIYDDLRMTFESLKNTMNEADELVTSLKTISKDLTREGSLVNQLANDTTVYPGIKATVMQLEGISEKANELLKGIQTASNDSNSTVGLLLNDQQTGASLKETIKNLESSSAKLDEDLEALQSNFLLRRYFKKKAKANKQE